MDYTLRTVTLTLPLFGGAAQMPYTISYREHADGYIHLLSMHPEHCPLATVRADDLRGAHRQFIRDRIRSIK